MKLTLVFGVFAALLLNQVDAGDIIQELEEELEFLEYLEDVDKQANINKVRAVEKRQVDPKDVQAMTDAGIKFDVATLIWTLETGDAGLDTMINTLPDSAKIRQSRVVFLEQGSDKAGLDHIWLRHSQDFENMLSISNKNDAATFIRNTMRQGGCRYTTRGSSRVEIKLYYPLLPSGNLNVAMGDNGFVVTSFPSSGNPPSAAIAC